MSMLNALALLGTGAEGFVQGNRDAEAAQRARDAEAFAQTQRSFQANQMQRTLQQQAAVDAAGQPIEATPDPTDPNATPDPNAPTAQNAPSDPDANGSPTRPPVAAPQTSTVAGQSGLNPMQTQAALAAQNSPDAIVQRQIAALSRTDPVAAMKMQAESLQSKAAMIDIANKTWNNDLAKARAGGLDGLVKFMSNSAGDGQGGQFKAKAVVSDDGKTFQIMSLQPDGSVQPTNLPPLPNDSDGWDKLAYGLATVPIEQRVAHAFAEKSQSEKAAHDMAMENQAAERNRVMEEWYAPRGQAALQNADTAAAKLNGAGNSLARLTPDDKAEYDDLKKKSSELAAALTKGRLDAAAMGQEFDPKNPTIAPLFEQQAIYNRKMSQIVGKYRSAAPAPAGATAPGAQGPNVIPPAMQAQRDAAAGAQIIATEYQGDIGKAQADLAQADAAAAKETGDKKQIIQSWADRLRAGIAATKAKGSPAAAPIAPMQSATKPPPIVPATPAAPVAPIASAAPSFMQQAATGDKTLNQIEANNVASMKPLNDAVTAARMAMAQAARSGNSAAAIQAAQALGDATRARDQAAQAKFGNRAPQYLASLGA